MTNNPKSISSKLQIAILDKNISSHCILDIDYFDSFNLKYGRENGDKLISILPNIISDKLLPSYLFHIGSDEFYFSFNEKNVLSRCTSFLNFLENEFGITACIGLVELDKPAKIESLFYILKSNVLLAKTNGKNLICSI